MRLFFRRLVFYGHPADARLGLPFCQPAPFSFAWAIASTLLCVFLSGGWNSFRAIRFVDPEPLDSRISQRVHHLRGSYSIVRKSTVKRDEDVYQLPRPITLCDWKASQWWRRIWLASRVVPSAPACASMRIAGSKVVLLRTRLPLSGCPPLVHSSLAHPEQRCHQCSANRGSTYCRRHTPCIRGSTSRCCCGVNTGVRNSAGRRMAVPRGQQATAPKTMWYKRCGQRMR
jgi:hypothetical protein